MILKKKLQRDSQTQPITIPGNQIRTTDILVNYTSGVLFEVHQLLLSDSGYC